MPESAIFDHYEVLKKEDGTLFELGRGAMGITYKAFDTSLRIPVALKVINGAYLNSEVARQRFIREARSAAKLRHRHVASVFHLGIEGDTYFYAMEFIDGETVDSLIRRQGALEPSLALRIATQVARALGEAQKHGLVHRDIKPANLMLVQEDEEVCAKVIDFGLAKSCRAEGDDAATISMGGFVGTPYFASPEQLEERDIDVRSDIYSLGVTLWYMLSGRTPFSGSVALVMSQHLSKPPPLEQLAALPAPVVAVLDRMLQKDPAKRQQTPVELRKELEECMQSLSGNSLDWDQTIVDAGRPGSPAPGSSGPGWKSGIATGRVLAKRYEVVSEAGEEDAGKIFRAREIEGGREVRLVALKPELIENAASYTRVEREVDRIKPVLHPNLARVFALERVESLTLLVLEWTKGFSLFELLRARRELGRAETLLLLKQAAEGADYAVQAGLEKLDLAARHIQIHFPDGKEERLLHSPVTEWPAFFVKLDPLGIIRELSISATWSGRSTLGGELGAAHGFGYVQALAGVARELLGGGASPGGYVPLAALSEEGNEVLKRALEHPEEFSSASHFVESLAGPGKTAGTPKAPERAAALPTPPAPEPAPKPPRKGKTLLVALGVVAAAAVTAAGITLWPHASKLLLPAPKKPPGTSPTPSAVAVNNATPPPAPIATPPAPTPAPTAAPILAAATPPPLPTPPPSPTRKQLLLQRLSEAEGYEAAQNWADCLAAYVRIAKDFPRADTGKLRLGLVLERFLEHPENLNDAEFESLRDPITDAAHLDVVAAMMILGAHLQKEDPVAGFNWYCAAAERGQVEAMTHVGLMYAKGLGVDLSYKKAVMWFQNASAMGDTMGKFCLGECLLRGKGTAKDEPKAVELLKEAAAAKEPRAMDLLGTCYDHGWGTEQNFQEAFRLYSEAADLHYWDSLANLAVLYINGEGVPKDPKKAADLFLEGSKDGSALCMFEYARCLESGTGVPAANREAAAEWYRKAAQAAYAPAVEWCVKNNIPIRPAAAP